jgi:2-haloacid dehalogenase
LASYQTLGAYGDVVPALQSLRERGNQIAVFTNGTSTMVNAAIEAANIAGLIDDVVSVESLEQFKTSPNVYAYLCERVDREANRVTLVSSNRWDVAGGAAFGLNTVWCNRTNAPDEYADLAPGRVVRTLLEV